MYLSWGKQGEAAEKVQTLSCKMNKPEDLVYNGVTKLETWFHIAEIC